MQINNEILNSWTDADNYLADRIETDESRISREYTVEWNENLTVHSCSILVIDKIAIVKGFLALNSSTSELAGGDMILKIKKGDKYIPFKKRDDAVIVGVQPTTGTLYISGGYTSGGSYQVSMNKPIMQGSGYNYHIFGLFELNI